MPITYRLDPGAVTYPGSTTYPGIVGAALNLLAFIDLSGSPSGAPNWSSLSDVRVRSFDVNRGRESELSEFDTGTASLTVDNRDRAFDPTFVTSPYYPYIRPMTRFLLQVDFSGTLYGLFLGYSDSFDIEYDSGGGDATVTVHLVDEFAALAASALPTTNPPRDGFAELAMTDAPVAYWDFSEDPAGRTFLATDLTPPSDSGDGSSGDAPEPLIRGDRRAFPSTHARRRK